MSAMHYATACLITFLYIFVSEVQSEYEYEYENEPKNCTASESIIGGTVEYSNGGVVGSLLIYHCSDGFEPYPISQKVCSSDGEWEPRVSRVKCEETNDYGDYEEPQKNCSLEVSIKGGNVSYSNEGLEGSMLTYHCKEGYYPFPATQRVCERDGQWSAMRLPNGRSTLNAVCKEILCPAQLQLDNGQFWPRKQWFKFKEKQTFSCHEGFDLTGDAERNCTQWGGWTGVTPVCDEQSEDCKNPGVPPGAFRSGERFRIGDKVRYMCQLGLDMLGPSERLCLDSKEWSGVEPRCYAQYSFDQPAIVAQALGGSLTAVMDVSHPNFKKKGQYLGRTVKVEEGRLNVFILLDTSGSISKECFQTAKTAIIQLVRKLDSYEVQMKFEIISYASEPKEIVSITSIESHDVEYILRKLKEFNETSHGSKKGTNLYKALDRVYHQLAFLRETKRNQFNETQNVIIIATDGHSNMGPKPQTILDKIRNLLGYKPSSVDHTQEELLDVYVFAVGEEVNRKDLTSIASSKKDEQHLFVLKDYSQLGNVFNLMISDSAVTKCGVAQEEQETTDPMSKNTYTRPWHVNLVWGAKICRGSIVTKSMVLTAAHCLIKLNADESVSLASASDIIVRHGDGEVKAMELILHPLFNVKGLKDKNVNEFYDYDIALVRMKENVTLSLKARPICLPCTKSSNRALRMNPDSTCDEHKRSLVHLEETPANFIRQGTRRSDTHIHSGAKRGECIQKARSTLPANSSVSLSEVITDRFMCTGGTETNRHEMTCKGDSGGALFLRKRMRYFQVAVISWGTKQTCDQRTSVRDNRPLDARDFHISVFSVMPWLKQHLNPELDFHP
ncbi:complement factor B [Pseudorasbora parva]|uniref:complement factor B n=1 Tax=Pseudorasbora parva TaxID=51549 RepID=UPI00351F3794